MKKIPIAFILSTLAVISSCTGVDEGRCPEQRETIVTGLGQSSFLMQSDGPQNNGSVRFDTFQVSEPVQAGRLMIAVVADAQFASYQTSPPISLLARIGNFFISNASALDCPAVSLLPEQALEDITITSDTAVSALYPVGSNLSSVFRVGHSVRDTSSPEFNIIPDSIVVPVRSDRLAITEFISTQSSMPLLLAMVMEVENPTASQHVFTITYSLDDGNIYTTQTEPVIIIP